MGAGRPLPRVSRHQGPAARPQRTTETPRGGAQVSGSGPVGGRAPPRPRRPRAAGARAGGGRAGWPRGLLGESLRAAGPDLGGRDLPRAGQAEPRRPRRGPSPRICRFRSLRLRPRRCAAGRPRAPGCSRLPRTFRSVSHASCAGARVVSSPQRTRRAQSVSFLCVFGFSVSQRVLLLWTT